MNAEELKIEAKRMLARHANILGQYQVAVLAAILDEFQQTLRQRVAEECAEGIRKLNICQDCRDCAAELCREIGRKGGD